jgi:hypothetical protein
MQRGRTVLHEAIRNRRIANDVDLIDLLLRRGADATVKDQVREVAPETGTRDNATTSRDATR